MAESTVDVNLISSEGVSDSWSLGCDITISDMDVVIQEIKTDDISLAGSVSVGEVSVDIDSDRTNVMDLDVNVVIDGINSSIVESQIVPYDKILEITDLSPETTNEKGYASSARATKIIYDLIVSLEYKVDINEESIQNLATAINDAGVTAADLEKRLKNLELLKEMFEWADEAHTTIKTKHNFYSEKTVASGGKASTDTSGGSGSGTGFMALEDWGKYDATLPQVLGAILGVELHNRLTAIENGSVTPDLSPYATISFVEQTINKLIGGASGAYDTLLEIQQILEGNEADITTILEEIATKASKEDVIALQEKDNEHDEALVDHETRIQDLEDKDEMFEWADEAHTTIKTKYNLYSEQTVASGGKGTQGSASSAGGGIMAISVNGETFSDTDDDRIVELPDYPTKVGDLENDKGYARASDVANTYATKTEHNALEERVETNENDIVSLKEKDTTIEEQIAGIKEITDHFFVDEHGLGTHKNFRSTGTIASGGAAQQGDGNNSGSTTGEYKMYVHNQSEPSDEWTINHGLNKMPNVKIIDSEGNQVYGDVKLQNMNVVTVGFGGVFSGTAYLD